MEESTNKNKIKGLVWILAATILAFLVAGGIHKIAAAVPWKAEKWLAQLIGPPPAVECHPSVQAQKYLTQVITRIYPIEKEDSQIETKFHVVHDKSINAFAMLGGQIYLNSALLEWAKNPEEVAAVLAHELSHVQKRHLLQGLFGHLFVATAFYYLGQPGALSEIAEQVANLKFTRFQEEEADLGALDRLQHAHISPQGFIDFFTRLENENVGPSLISDHPAPQDRALLARKYLSGDSIPLLKQEEWQELRQYCQR